LILPGFWKREGCLKRNSNAQANKQSDIAEQYRNYLSGVRIPPPASIPL
jgi:hypothetical protein